MLRVFVLFVVLVCVVDKQNKKKEGDAEERKI